jgi:anti-anti-sigma regulatory factor
MLRITTVEDADAIIFRLEGKLAGPWVKELETCCRNDAGGPNGLRIDLREVTFIDAAGKKLLARLHQDGAELEAADCMTKAIIETITRSPGDHLSVARHFLSTNRFYSPPAP